MLARFIELEEKKIAFGVKNYIWKFCGFIGNIFFRRPPPDMRTEDGKVYINMGCGQKRIDGWINADFYRLHNLFWNRKLLPDWMLDLSMPINCDDCFCDGILFEHVNEHLPYSQNYFILKEAHRILVDNGILRIVIPDLDIYLNWNTYRSKTEKMARYYSLPEAISNLTQNHTHTSVWNFDLMSELLAEVGFKEIKKVNFGEANCIDMRGVDSIGHRWESVYIEARK